MDGILYLERLKQEVINDKQGSADSQAGTEV
jgi:hypothetical protein